MNIASAASISSWFINIEKPFDNTSTVIMPEDNKINLALYHSYFHNNRYKLHNMIEFCKSQGKTNHLLWRTVLS
jgi:hypothetical protein